MEQTFRDGFIREQHELFNQLMRNIVFDFLDPRARTVLVEPDLHFRKFERQCAGLDAQTVGFYLREFTAQTNDHTLNAAIADDGVGEYPKGSDREIPRAPRQKFPQKIQNPRVKKEFRS